MNPVLSFREDLEDKNAGAFAAWAEVYDRQANPLLHLEQRFLERMLPDTNGRSILDLGCGTGRWLDRLARLGTPECSIGLDASPEMLAVAARRGLSGTNFIEAVLPSIPVSSASVDLILASFVLGYVDDLDLCASEMDRVVRDQGDAFITDMHPCTAIELGWERRFSLANSKHVLTAHHWPIAAVVQLMDQNGFELLALHEPCFGHPERAIFYSHNMLKEWQAAEERSAVYLLHFRKATKLRRQTTQGSLLIESAQCVLGDSEAVSADISIYQRNIRKTYRRKLGKDDPKLRINLDGYVLFPGLINAHDHLEFALFPRLGAPPYGNATEWALDIQDRFAPTIALHKRVPRATRLWWGALRNLLCGVTTVCHHNPIDPVFRDGGFPVKVMTGFGWEHSPQFAKDLCTAWEQTGSKEPFIIHACEGTDSTAARDLQVLKEADAIGPRTVLVHGLALNADDIQYLNGRGASLVACMSSNQFLFQQTASLEQVRLIERLALGSDSPLTAVGDLLDEIRFCRNVIGMSASMLYAAVTEEPVRILRLKEGEGRIVPGSPADVFAVRASSLTPAEQLASLSWQAVELVMVAGSVRLASSEMLARLPDSCVQGLNPITIDGVVRWLAAPTVQMFQAAADILGPDGVSLCGRRVSVKEL
ncbi:methyltransferase domain-containing protein [Edaphobacter sp. HDX4]|uniref:methyltransferase domain-containing protein n=1 Tax=Edaphobacter sp. HDX4 TaxID=2794064 RepID=UPI002FE635B5